MTRGPKRPSEGHVPRNYGAPTSRGDEAGPWEALGPRDRDLPTRDPRPDPPDRLSFPSLWVGRGVTDVSSGHVN